MRVGTTAAAHSCAARARTSSPPVARVAEGARPVPRTRPAAPSLLRSTTPRLARRRGPQTPSAAATVGATLAGADGTAPCIGQGRIAALLAVALGTKGGSHAISTATAAATRQGRGVHKRAALAKGTRRGGADVARTVTTPTARAPCWVAAIRRPPSSPAVTRVAGTSRTGGTTPVAPTASTPSVRLPT